MYQRFVKRMLDVILSLCGVVLLSPVFLILAVWIKLDSPGPVFFKQKRVGKHKTYFNILKFRTMRTDAPHDMPTHLLENPEAFITRSGAFLRRTSLDELPQIFNVLLGHMSLVGPRPYLPSEKEEMGEFASTVLMAKPGITGYWQTSGRSNVSFDDRVRMDCWYICNWNLWLDVVMLFKTVKVVLMRKGAY